MNRTDQALHGNGPTRGIFVEVGIIAMALSLPTGTSIPFLFYTVAALYLHIMSRDEYYPDGHVGGPVSSSFMLVE